MKCRKCSAEIPDESKFCMKCGAKQELVRTPRRRGNGQGSVFQRPNKKWIAIITVGYEVTPEGTKKKITRSKSGFKTKKEALDYLPKLSAGGAREEVCTMTQLYDAWLPTHRAGKDTMNCYKAAWKYFAPIRFMRVSDITIDDLQDCMDDCPKGRRTKENMKALAGLLYKYGIPRRYTDINMGEYLIVTGETSSKEGLPSDALEKIRRAVGTVTGADYVLCQCYLGFRPSELLALRGIDYDAKEKAFIGGSKTDAGRDRVVTVSPKIQPIIDRLTFGKKESSIFCNSDGSAMSLKSYRALFYDVLERCGIENPTTEIDGITRHKYTPHSCRHTFATLMKRVPGEDKDKLELIGHTSTEMLRHYQDVSLDDLRRITNAL